MEGSQAAFKVGHTRGEARPPDEGRTDDQEAAGGASPPGLCMRHAASEQAVVMAPKMSSWITGSVRTLVLWSCLIDWRTYLVIAIDTDSWKTSVAISVISSLGSARGRPSAKLGAGSVGVRFRGPIFCDALGAWVARKNIEGRRVASAGLGQGGTRTCLRGHRGRGRHRQSFHALHHDTLRLVLGGAAFGHGFGLGGERAGGVVNFDDRGRSKNFSWVSGDRAERFDLHGLSARKAAQELSKALGTTTWGVYLMGLWHLV